MKPIRFVLLVLPLLLLCGCAEERAAETPAPTAVETPAPTPTPVPTPSPAPTPTRSAILLVGGETIEANCGEPFVEPGWLACDRDGNDCSERVRVEGTLRPWRRGEQSLRYFFDDGGTEVSARRTVVFQPKPLPEAAQPAPGTVFLSFDDGPCENTGQVLDILDKYQIKATFFVVLSRTKHLELLPEILERGHSLGIHAWYHPWEGYEDFYSSEDNYFKDFLEAQRIFRERTGSFAWCYRFPGGSRGAGYLAGRMEGGTEELLQIFRDMGVRCYDWNLQPESGEKTTEATLRNFRQGLQPDRHWIILQHDTRLFSVAALDRMIAWALENGYTFAPLEPTVPDMLFLS